MTNPYRALLGEPVAEGLTIPSHYRGHEIAVYRDGFYAGYKEVLAIARYGRPTPQPVPVSERLPGPEDCDAEGRCWWWRSDGVEEFWELTCVPDPISHNSKCAENVSYGPWLPAHALPNPEATND